MENNFKLIYITFDNIESAESVIRHLLEEKLIACANIIPSVKSYYWWEETIQSSEEYIVIAKTIASNVEGVIDKVKQIHEYDCPCVLAFNVDAGNQGFLDWMQKSVNICLQKG